MTNKIINWDSLNFSERLQFLKTIGWHETHHGWVDAYGIETWEAKDLATLHWAEIRRENWKY